MRRLGVVQEGPEASSRVTSASAAWLPCSGATEPIENEISFQVENCGRELEARGEARTLG